MSLNVNTKRDAVPRFRHRGGSKPIISVLLLGILLVSGLFADPRMPGDPLLEALRSAYVRAGRVQPFTSFPVTEDESRGAVDELARDPAADSETVEALRAALPPPDRLDAGIALSYVRYLRTSEEYVEDYADKNGIDLYRLYLSEPAPIRYYLGWEGADGLFLSMEQTLRRQMDDADFFKEDNFYPLGADGNPVAIENNNFTRGNLGWVRNGYRFSFGREKAHIGPETWSSLWISDRIPYINAARTSIPIGPFRMDWYVSTIRPLEVVNTGLDPADPYGYFRTDNQTVILDILHRFEWRGRRVRVAVGGDQTIARPNNYFELADFFPILSWHSTHPKPYNPRAIADASWVFLPGWTVSGQAGFDDFNAGIIGVGDTEIPTIDAYILGLRWDGDASGRRVAAALEGGYTHYLWGSYDEVAVGHTATSSGTLGRAVYRLKLDEGSQGIPLGSPYGPGALWFRGGLDLPDLGPGLSLKAGAPLLSKNTAADLLNTLYEASSAVENAPRTLYFELAASARYSWKSLSFTFAPLFAVRDGEIWAELALGASWKYEIRKTVDSGQ